MPSTIDNVASALQRAGRWLQEHGGSKQFTAYRWPSTTESFNTKTVPAESAGDPQSLGEVSLSITLTSKDSQGQSEAFSASFATNGSSALEALKFLSQLPNTSLTRLRSTLLDEWL